MKYSEFKLLIKNMRLEIIETQSNIFIKDFYFKTIAMVSKERHTLNTNFKEFNELSLEKQKFLTHKCMELALTPLKEREDEVKYYYKLNGIGGQLSFLNKLQYVDAFVISTFVDAESTQSTFTDSEFEALPEDIKSHNWKKIKVECEEE